jgi:hypothetical protein
VIANHVIERGSRALIRHVSQIVVELQFEEFAREVAGRTNAG